MPWVSCAFSNVLQICPFRHGQNKTGSESLGSFRDQAGWIEVLWKGKESQPGGFGVGVGDLLFPDKPLWSMANMDIGPTLPTIRESPRWKGFCIFVQFFLFSPAMWKKRIELQILKCCTGLTTLPRLSHSTDHSFLSLPNKSEKQLNG